MLSVDFPLSPDPYTRYKFWLKAFTWKHEGEPSRPALSALTDVDMPSAPHLANLTCVDDNSLAVEWDRPDKVHGKVCRLLGGISIMPSFCHCASFVNT